VIEGDVLAKFIQKRARKGYSVLDTKPVIKRQAGLF